MNSGIIAARYARALVKFIKDKEVGNQVYGQAQQLAYKMVKVPHLRDFIQRHAFLTDEKKIRFMEEALGEPLVPEFKRFISLVLEHKRIEFFTFILSSFISQYEEEMGIRTGTLIVAHPVDGLVERLEEILTPEKHTTICLHTIEDPSLIGGFIFEMDNTRVDASVKHKLELIRNNLVRINNRIV